jgi:flagellin
MSVRIATNTAALTALGALELSQQRLDVAARSLASGSRITRAADDAAGLAISQSLTSQIQGLVQAVANSQDATAVTAIADGALASVHETLQRMRMLVLRAANTGGGSPSSLAAIAREVGALTKLLDAIADFTASGGRTLLDGSYRGVFQVGVGGGDNIVLDLSRADIHASNLGGTSTGGGIDLTALNILGLDGSEGLYTVEGVRADLATLSESIVAVSATRSQLGAVANQLAHTMAGLNTAIAAVTASRSGLTDADMADQAQRFVASTITTHTAAFVLAQANSAPEAVLRLLDHSTGSARAGGGRGTRSGSAPASASGGPGDTDDAAPHRRSDRDARSITSGDAGGSGTDASGGTVGGAAPAGRSPAVDATAMAESAA